RSSGAASRRRLLHGKDSEASRRSGARLSRSLVRTRDTWRVHSPHARGCRARFELEYLRARRSSSGRRRSPELSYNAVITLPRVLKSLPVVTDLVDPRDRDVARAIKLADWLDDRYLDPIVGLVFPEAGDLAMSIVGLYIVFVAVRRRMPAI